MYRYTTDQALLPDIRERSRFYIFQKDSATGSWNRQAADKFDSIPATLWPPNSPNLNSVDYRNLVSYQSRMEDVD